MLEAIAGWVKNIIIIVLFASFLELLLPNSSLQRFIRVIMGLLIMLAILNPAIDLLHSYWDSGNIPVLGASRQKQADIIRIANTAVEDRDKLAREIYKRDLMKQIRALIMAIDGVAEVRVYIDLNEKADYGGAIEKITLYVKPGTTLKSATIGKIALKPEHPEFELSEN